MFRPVRLLLLSLSGLSLLGGTAEAQARRGLVDVTPPEGRRGFWLEGGLGWGREAYKYADDPFSASLGKPTINIQLGGTVSQTLRLGAELGGWVNTYTDEDGYEVTESLSHLLAVARVYPARSTGLFLKGGVGLGVTSASVEYGNTSSESGLGYSLGVGYELPISGKLYLTPQFGYYRSSYEKRDDDTLHERLLNFSLSITWQPAR